MVILRRERSDASEPRARGEATARGARVRAGGGAAGNLKFAKRPWPPIPGLQRGWGTCAERPLRELLVHARRAGAAAIAVAVALAAPPTASGQSASVEVDVTAGASTDGIRAGSLQARLFGATRSDWRGYAELTWADTAGEYPSDAFGTAYPYDGRVRAMEAFAEKTFRPGRSLLGFRAGRYRTPFGISGRSDHAYAGFLRAPLVRYGTNFALSNNFLEAGAELFVGVPSLYVQGTLGVPSDEGPWQRQDGLDAVVRVQGYARGFIVGASYLHTQPSDRRSFVRGDMVFRGVDGRWTAGRVEIRGEWLDGRPFDNVATRGGYLDGFVRIGPVTAVARVEKLDYDAGRFSQYFKRMTAGARVRIRPWLVAQANVVRQPGELADGRDHAVDIAVTLTRRF